MSGGRREDRGALLAVLLLAVLLVAGLLVPWWFARQRKEILTG